MGQDLSRHPMYRDEAEVRKQTLWHLDRGHTVFQLFQLQGGERAHSLSLLSLARLPFGASVLSLGSGVGGMERYWQETRPDLSFELVNITQTQLDLCLCEGHHVLADAETYRSPAQFDAVVIAYTLGHLGLDRALESALTNVKSGGVLILYDVFDGSDEFRSALHYETPKLHQIETFGVVHDLRFQTVLEGGFEAPQHVQSILSPMLLRQATPALFVLRKP